MRSILSLNIFPSPPVLAYGFYRDANSILLSKPLYRNRLYAQNPVFEIAHQESVKMYSTHIGVRNNL